MRGRVLFALALTLSVTMPLAADDPGDLELLASWLGGSFSSAAQAEADPEFFDIRLHMARIWDDRDDGYWLYVEQASADALDRPYRQRVYHLIEVAEGLFESRVLALPEPSRYVGAWRDEQPLADLSAHDLIDRPGCSILMRRRADSFIGGTLGALCTSTLRGAQYATSQVVITADSVTSWDRGFDGEDRQVWGATKGGYVFDRVQDGDQDSPAGGAAEEPAQGDS
jgi:hypothetical protein